MSSGIRVLLFVVLSLSAFGSEVFVKSWADAQGETAPVLNVCVSGINEGRVKDFEQFLNENGMKVKTAAPAKLSRAAVADYDVVIIDPDPGGVNKSGQSDRSAVRITEELGKPVVVIGAPGSYSLIELRLKFGGNG